MNRTCRIAVLVAIAAGCGRSRVDPVVEVHATATQASPNGAVAEIKTTEGDWPSWRGPLTDGIAAGPAVPTHWTETDNVIWKTEIPGRGHSSPIIVGDRICFETADEKDETQSVVCLNRIDGNLLWQSTLHKGRLERFIHKENTQASSTLACDGERLYALFLNDGHIWATALDLNGKEVWKQNVGGFHSRFGYSASPALYHSLVLLAADHEQGGFVAALNRLTGDVVWRKKRPAKSSYASPRVISVGGRDQMILGGCKLVCSYNPFTGDELWQTEGTAEAGVGTAVVDGELIFASGGYPDQNTVAVDSSGKSVWQNNIKSYVPSMLAHAGHLYVTPDDGVFRCFEAKSGKELWKKRIGGNFRASPLLSGGHIYTTDMLGKTIVFKASPDACDIVAENQLGNEAFSSPAVSRGQLFLRVADSSKSPRQEWIYCIGQPPTAN